MFQGFVDKASRTDQAAVQTSLGYKNVCVLGGDLDGQLLAALCFAEGAQVRVFTAYASEIESMANGIALQGKGPVGNYHVNQSRGPSIQVSGALDACLAGSELIFLTGPIHKQRTYAMVLADHLKDGQVLVLPNARTFGAFEALTLLKIGGASADITMVELQGMPYWYKKPHNALVLEEAGDVTCACIPTERTAATVAGLTNLIPGLSAQTNALQTSLSECSSVVEVPALLLGGPALKGGGKPIPMGGVPLEENASFFNLIGDQQLDVINALLNERSQVAQRFGVRELPKTDALLARHAGSATGDGVRPIPTHDEAIRLLRDTAIGSLVPLTEVATVADVQVPVTNAMVQLCSTVLGSDIATSGRRLHSIGIEPSSFDTVFNRLRATAKTGL